MQPAHAPTRRASSNLSAPLHMRRGWLQACAWTALTRMTWSCTDSPRTQTAPARRWPPLSRHCRAAAPSPSAATMPAHPCRIDNAKRESSMHRISHSIGVGQSRSFSVRSSTRGNTHAFTVVRSDEFGERQQARREAFRICDRHLTTPQCTIPKSGAAGVARSPLTHLTGIAVPAATTMVPPCAG